MSEKISEKTKTDFGFVKPVLKLGFLAFTIQFIYERVMIYAVQGRDFQELYFERRKIRFQK